MSHAAYAEGLVYVRVSFKILVMSHSSHFLEGSPAEKLRQKFQKNS